MMSAGYDHKQIEEKWLKVWEEWGLFVSANKDVMGQRPEIVGEVTWNDLDEAEKLYLLFAFAYPSGAGLHVGHVESKTALDIMARYYRMKGKRVFFPVGWDAFGLPAENYAIQTGVPPAVTTKQAIDTFRQQVKRLGISYDWAKEIATSHPEYYKWTQWLFLKLFEAGLAYKAPGRVNWCPSCQTVLANEQVIQMQNANLKNQNDNAKKQNEDIYQKQEARSMKQEAVTLSPRSFAFAQDDNNIPDGGTMVGVCERCETPVVQRELEQWYFRITDYADELISGLDQVDWPEATKQQQLNWIGRREGVEVRFMIYDSRFKKEIKTFTTRVDTIFGVTFIVISPELAEKWMSEGWEANGVVRNYVRQAFGKTEEERKVGEKEKTGVRTGLEAVNPVSGERVPVCIADYVLAEYGTGAVMGVPAHDERDLAFAKKYGLPIRQVIAKPSGELRSYLMGAEQIEDGELESLGIRIVKKTHPGARWLIVPKSSLDQYRDLLAKKLSPGYWNEWIGEEIGFLFKNKAGEVRLVDLNEQTNQEIDRLAAEYNGEQWTKAQSVWEWLAENEFYQDVITHSEYGVLVNSGKYDGLISKEAMEQIPSDFGEVMEVTTQYRLRDWLISRQRYWGAPIPVVYDPEGKAHPVKEEHLPWKLPTDVEFKPTGESPLVNSAELKERVERLYGKGWTPEYDTMDTFVDSSWYYMRYVDARNSEVFARQSLLKEWLPVDFYMIGPEHIVLHLLYSRFFTKFLRDHGYLCNVKGQRSNVKDGIDPDDHELHRKMGLWCVSEPFSKMRHQGMILGPDHKKMSKSKGNVINPDEIVEEYGADTLRMYEMFMGPLEADKPWDPRAVRGVYRFLTRVQKAVMETVVYQTKLKEDENLRGALQGLIAKVSEDIPALKFNTAIAAMMEFVNEWEETFKKANKRAFGALKATEQVVATASVLSIEEVKNLVKLLAPFAPYLAEELWQHVRAEEARSKKQEVRETGKQQEGESDDRMRKDDDGKTKNIPYSKQNSVHWQTWPEVDKSLLQGQPMLVVQVNGKKRSALKIQSSKFKTQNYKEEIINMAKKDVRVKTWLEGKEVKKVIWVEPTEKRQGLLNFVIG